MLLGDRQKTRFNESLLAPLFRFLPGNWKSINAQDVAQALLTLAFSPNTSGVQIIGSAQLRAIAAERAFAK